MTTRIWYENNALNVTDVGSLPARSLTATISGSRVMVADLGGRMIAQLGYDQYARKDGSTFTSAAAVKAYLDAEFVKYLAGLTFLATATVGETLGLAVSLGVRRYDVPVPGAAIGDRIVVTLTSAPTNGTMQDAYVSAAGVVKVGLLVPALGLGTPVAVPLAFYRVS